jgi:hypothetical protein
MRKLTLRIEDFDVVCFDSLAPGDRLGTVAAHDAFGSRRPFEDLACQPSERPLRNTLRLSDCGTQEYAPCLVRSDG